MGEAPERAGDVAGGGRMVIRRRRRAVRAETAGPGLVVATYNVHSCVGVDRRYDPDRVADVLRELGADIIGLQEVTARPRRAGMIDQRACFAAATGLAAVPEPPARDHRSRFGNALLTRFPVHAVRHIDLSVPGFEPRGAIDAELVVGGRRLRVVVTHLGLRATERRLQIRRLLDALTAHPGGAEATVVLGDLNEWRGRRGAIPVLDRRLGRAPVRRTFPSWLPVLPLDRIYAAGTAKLAAVAVHRSALARVASDHLPLRASVAWKPSAPP
jgi:endonuclease/exonuclease/phosphatase family metal-dependent hydrolase